MKAPDAPEGGERELIVLNRAVATCDKRMRGQDGAWGWAAVEDGDPSPPRRCIGGVLANATPPASAPWGNIRRRGVVIVASSAGQGFMLWTNSVQGVGDAWRTRGTVPCTRLLVSA